MLPSEIIGREVEHVKFGKGTMRAANKSSNNQSYLEIVVAFNDAEKTLYCDNPEFIEKIFSKGAELFKSIFFVDATGFWYRYDDLMDTTYTCKDCGKVVTYTKKQRISDLKQGKKQHKYCIDCHKKYKKAKEQIEQEHELNYLIRNKVPTRRDAKKHVPHDTDGMSV